MEKANRYQTKNSALDSNYLYCQTYSWAVNWFHIVYGSAQIPPFKTAEFCLFSILCHLLSPFVNFGYLLDPTLLSPPWVYGFSSMTFIVVTVMSYFICQIQFSFTASLFIVKEDVPRIQEPCNWRCQSWLSVRVYDLYFLFGWMIFVLSLYFHKIYIQINWSVIKQCRQYWDIFVLLTCNNKWA